MKFKDQILWSKCRKNNTDPYGKAVIDYAERWAEAMEKLISKGHKIEDIAETTSHTANTDGISGFMYGAAVATLAECWEHGEELRRWHNLKTQLGNEGERANEKGTVLNPALLEIK